MTQTNEKSSINDLLLIMFNLTASGFINQSGKLLLAPNTLVGWLVGWSLYYHKQELLRNCCSHTIKITSDGMSNELHWYESRPQ